jgi:hypothetical protein
MADMTRIFGFAGAFGRGVLEGNQKPKAKGQKAKGKGQLVVGLAV